MDQLCAYFKQKYEGNYVACDDGQSLLYIADKTTYQVKLCLYTVKTDYSPNENDDSIIIAAVEKVLPSIVKNPIYQFAIELSKTLKVKFIPVYFPGKEPQEGETSNPPKFVISNLSGNKTGIKDEVTFKTGLHELIDVQPNDVPPKKKNKSVADFFHEWSRDNLACGDSGITKCDLDGMFIDSNNTPAALIEIKRSKQISAMDWKPFTNDYTGLHLLFNVARKANAEFWVIHHGTERTAAELDKRFNFSLFKIEGFDGNGNPKYAPSQQPYTMEQIDFELESLLGK